MELHVLKEAAINNSSLILQPYDTIFDIVGFDGLVVFLSLLGGKSVYVPSLRTVLAKCIESEVIKERHKKHVSINSLARKYGYSSRYLRKLLNDK